MDIMLRAREVVAARSWSTSSNMLFAWNRQPDREMICNRGSLAHLESSTHRIVSAGWRIVST
jgi:hypothetical protein